MGIDNSITADFQTHFYVDSAYPEAVRQFHFFLKNSLTLKSLTTSPFHSLVCWFSEDLGLNPGFIMNKLYSSLSYFKSYFIYS